MPGGKRLLPVSVAALLPPLALDLLGYNDENR